jgi:RimK family alpha-L-glutamate ligase
MSGVHSPRVAIITEEPGWHGRQLRKALAERGYAARYVSLTGCRLRCGRGPLEVFLPGFTSTAPAGVFVRGIPGGTLEQVIFRLDVLHVLHEAGVVVYNPPRVIERTVDKALTSFLLQRAGLPTPVTWVCESAEQARVIVRRETATGRRLVAKPLFGCQGLGLTLIDIRSGLLVGEQFAGVYYLQQFVERAGPEWTDARVFVVDGKAIAAMQRRGASWITNRARGARCEPLTLEPGLAQLAEDASRAVGAHYAGIDLILDSRQQWQVIEVNGIPAWIGLHQTTGVNIAGYLVESFLSRISPPHKLAALP